MKIKELYNPTILAQQYTGLIQAINAISPIGANWLSEMGQTVEALDDFIKLKIGERTVFRAIGECVEANTYIRMSHILSSYNYQLDGLWELLIPNDASENGYNPLDNVNEVRHEEKDIDFDLGSASSTFNKGSETNTINGGARKNTTSNGAKSDTQTQENTTTAFDTTDYEKGTDKSVITSNEGAYNVETSSDAFTDSTSASSREDTTTNSSRHDDTKEVYDVKRHGNIGVTTSFDLIAGDRKVHYYNFFNEVIRIFEDEILSSMLWEV